MTRSSGTNCEHERVRFNIVFHFSSVVGGLLLWAEPFSRPKSIATVASIHLLETVSWDSVLTNGIYRSYLEGREASFRDSEKESLC